MKTKINIIFAVGIILLLTQNIDAQILIEETNITPPHFPSKEIVVKGEIATSIHDYLIKNIAYSHEYNKTRLAGTEVIRLQVSAQGHLTSFEVINSISPEIDDMMIRILETSSGYWAPGTINGKPASMTWEVSLVFKPSPVYDLIGTARKYQDKANAFLFEKSDPKRALRYYTRACTLLPYEDCILAAICLCRYKLGDEIGYMNDLDRLMTIHPFPLDDQGSPEPTEMLAHLNTIAFQLAETR